MTMYALATLAACIGSFALFFFVSTRLSYEARRILRAGGEQDRHVYAVYRYPWLIRLVDRQWIASLILLLQYDRLVEKTIAMLGPRCTGKRILQVSCAFGNVTERIVRECAGTNKLCIFDIIHAELTHTRNKVRAWTDSVSFFQGDASSMAVGSEKFDKVVAYFLFHELPDHLQYPTFEECLRVLKHGGTFVFAEFHRPRKRKLRAFGRTFLSVYEPHALRMWDWDPTAGLDTALYQVRKKLVFFDYFQVTAIQKL